MVTIENIKQILECSDIYAQKLIEYAQDDEKELINIINQKLKERRTRPAMVVFGGGTNEPGNQFIQ
ncbi:hypothetical protein MUA48_08025 [Staphylococcus sp. IVB6238]|uniref:hypothetical protein n=1 Tax=Staphylococcus sp. IVB6238 TaxID=2989770 RepID=UPI0021D3786A|nr:hypothetical protein [Staphylococcus sp. IVB6238]UXR74982.1 hypothetical protein MUA48_08025 [Staphylococcus sp. IVB6238]